MRESENEPGPYRPLAPLLACWLLTTLGPTGAQATLGGDAAPDPPDEVVYPSLAGEVSFPHLLHHEDMGIPCEDCHHETDASALDLPHPEYFDDFWIECEGCHRPGSLASGPQPCDACHHSAPSGIADETLSAKVVVHESCWACHPTGTGAEASSTCATCHQRSPEDET